MYIDKCTYCSKEWRSPYPGRFRSSSCNHMFNNKQARLSYSFKFNCVQYGFNFVDKKQGVKFCSHRRNNKYLYEHEYKQRHAVLKKNYNRNHLGVVAEQRKHRYHTAINFKTACILRARLKQAIKNGRSSAIKNLGCSIDELKKYLESKFQPGMTLDNYGKNSWHINHIKPLSSFDLTGPEQVKLACHYTNLQPLWRYDNLSKGGTQWDS